MEKTILYSKKSCSVAHNLDVYQTCEHQHCKQLLTHIKFLSNALTQKVLKEQFSSTGNILKAREMNIPGNLMKIELSKSLQEEMQQVRKNYTKLRKQLGQVESQNDELFEQNQTLKKKIQKLADQVHKSTMELAATQSQSPTDTKNSFYQPQTACCHSCDINHRNKQTMTIIPRDVDLALGKLLSPLESAKVLEGLNNNGQSDRSEFGEKYEKLNDNYKRLEEQVKEQKKKRKQNDKYRKRLEYENQQLKKIIKLRNQIQKERHNTIHGLKSVIDEMITEHGLDASGKL